MPVVEGDTEADADGAEMVERRVATASLALLRSRRQHASVVLFML